VRGLAGRVALVTGGNGGIGKAICERLRAEGVHVAIGVVEELDQALDLAERLTGPEVRSIAVSCDVTDDSSIVGAVERAAAELGPLSILVNNAGKIDRVPFGDIEPATWHDALDVSLSGSYRCSRAALPALRASHGTIVNLTSELVWLGGRLLAHYVAAKAGVVGLTRALASELGDEGIRVNAVAPGPTETRMLAAAARDPSFIDSIPLRRLGLPDDVAAAVAFLSSDDAAWITGQILGVNGGLVMAS
jgi:2-hydroxycyclohexanecarboxyl-CoA dehydrogenase